MELSELTPDYNIVGFDCEDEDLNDFINENALAYQDKHIANTYVLKKGKEIVAYFCLLTDKISRYELTNSKWKSIQKNFPPSKQFHSYPSIKIGRFAVSKAYKGLHIGSDLIKLIKQGLGSEKDGKLKPAFRFLTVDAYLSAIPFYESNGFKQLNKKDENNHTRLMYFDMMEFA